MTPRLFALCDGSGPSLASAARIADLGCGGDVALVLRMPHAHATDWRGPLAELCALAEVPGGPVVGLNVGGRERGATAAQVCSVARDRRLAWLWLPERAEPADQFAPAGARVLRACHSQAAVAAALAGGADLAVVSPVWPTLSKPGATPYTLAGLGTLTRRFPGRVVALGGVDARTAPLALAEGAAGVAALRGAESVARWLRRAPR